MPAVRTAGTIQSDLFIEYDYSWVTVTRLTPSQLSEERFEEIRKHVLSGP